MMTSRFVIATTPTSELASGHTPLVAFFSLVEIRLVPYRGPVHGYSNLEQSLNGSHLEQNFG